MSAVAPRLGPQVPVDFVAITPGPRGYLVTFDPHATRPNTTAAAVTTPPTQQRKGAASSGGAAPRQTRPLPLALLVLAAIVAFWSALLHLT